MQGAKWLSFEAKGHCTSCGETVFSLDRRHVLRALFRGTPLLLECARCDTGRMATASERLALGNFLSDETIPIDLLELELVYAQNENRGGSPSAQHGSAVVV